MALDKASTFQTEPGDAAPRTASAAARPARRGRAPSAPPRLGALLCVLLLGFAATARSLRAAQEPPPAEADKLGDMSLEELLSLRIEKVFSASKYEQQVTRAPASVTIVTGEEIRRFGHRTLAEVLRAVRGLYVTYDRNYSNIGIRGFARPGDFNTRVLLLVNGHRMNDNLYDSALIGPEATLDLELVERIEIIRGPSSSIYGNSAFFGVINVITRSGAQLDGVEAGVEGGSFSTYRGRLAYGKQLDNGLEAVVSASYLDSDGAGRLFFPELDNPRNNHGIAENADGEASRNLFGRLAYRGFTLAGAYSRRDKTVPTASFGTAFNTGREKTTDERTYLDLQYDRALSPETQLLARAAYDWYAYRADYPYDYAAPGALPFIVVSHDDDYGDGVEAEVQVTRRFLGRQIAVFGGEYRADLHLYQSNFNDDPKTYNFRSDRQGQSLGLYTQTEIELGSRLLLNAGMRYDYYDNFGGTLNPRFGLIYNPQPTTTVKLLYGRAFRAPNAYERYLESPGFNKANPNLKPETIRTYELVLEQYLPHGLLFTASGYRYGIRQLITQIRDPADGLLVFENVDDVNAKGLELGMETRLSNGLLARVSYAWQEAEDEHSERELNNSPRHMAKLNLSVPLAGGAWSTALEMQYLSSLRTLAGNAAPGFLLANATLLGRGVVKGLDLSLSLYNLFDRSYAYPGSTGHVQDVIAQDGRSFRVKLTYGI
jgi:iron complex outermembrane receptor protein